MIKNFWMRVIKHSLIVVIPSVIAIITLFAIFSKIFEKSLSERGIIFAFLILFVCLIGTLSIEINRVLKEVQLQSQAEHPSLSQQELINTVDYIFRAIAASIKFPGTSPKIVIHYFYHSKIGDEDFLIKDRRYSVEEEPRAVDFSMEKCRLNSKNMVMCEAFSANRVIFRNLPPNHKDTYDADIKDYIDSDIHWVLACPVWKGSNTLHKLGVVVIFGTSHIIDDTDKNKIRALENIGLLLSTSISYSIENTSCLNLN